MKTLNDLEVTVKELTSGVSRVQADVKRLKMARGGQDGFMAFLTMPEAQTTKGKRPTPAGFIGWLAG